MATDAPRLGTSAPARAATTGGRPPELWGAAAVAVAYVLLHVLLVAALVAFGLRAGGFPLQPLAVLVYGLAGLAGTALAARSALGGTGVVAAEKLLPLLALALFLASALPGLFFATERLPGDPLALFGLRTTHPPYLDDDGAFAWTNLALAVWVVALALAAGWRGLLVGAAGAQGLALLINPALLPGAARYGLHPDGYPLLALPALYAGAGVALGWRPRRAHAAAAAALVVGGVALAALLTLGVFPELGELIARQPTMAARVPELLLATGALHAVVLGLPLAGWRLRAWASRRPPDPRVAAGVGLALVAGAAALTWRYLGPGPADNYLPAEGQTMGWIGRTVPQGAYGAPGELLLWLKRAFPWLLGAAALVWLAGVLHTGQRLRFGRAARRFGLPGGLALLGFGVLFQGLPGPFLYPVPLPVQPLAATLVNASGERGLQALAFFGLPPLGLALLGLAAALRPAPARRRPWLVFAALGLALPASAILSAGLVGGTLRMLELQRELTLTAHREEVLLRLALSVPVGAGFALAGWATVAAGARALRRSGRDAVTGRALRRGAVVATAAVVLAALVFWRLTAMPVAETSPGDGAAGVPTNAPVVVRLTPGERGWGPGVCASYAGTDGCVPGATGGFPGGVSFVPEGGWRPNARVEVRVCCGPFTRSYRFSFTTGAGPAPDVPPPPGRAPRPTAPRSTAPGWTTPTAKRRLAEALGEAATTTGLTVRRPRGRRR